MEAVEKQGFSGHQKSEGFLREPNPEVQPKDEETAQQTQYQEPEQQPQQPAESGNGVKKIKEWWFQLKKFGKECRRVLKVTQKPNKEEFLTIAKVSALGMSIIGLIGFALSMIQQLIL